MRVAFQPLQNCAENIPKFSKAWCTLKNGYLQWLAMDSNSNLLRWITGDDAYSRFIEIIHKWLDVRLIVHGFWGTTGWREPSISLVFKCFHYARGGHGLRHTGYQRSNQLWEGDHIHTFNGELARPQMVSIIIVEHSETRNDWPQPKISDVGKRI